MAADAPPWLKGDAGLRALQQAMIRLIQCIQTRAMAEGGLSDDMKEIINQTNDALVDVIEKVERRST